MADEAGKKNDVSKLRYDLIPNEQLMELARVYTIGAGKYGDKNYRKGILWHRIYAAMMRHLEAWRRGEQLDPEDGQHHLASVAWGAFTLMEFESCYPEGDDLREKKNG